MKRRAKTIGKQDRLSESGPSQLLCSSLWKYPLSFIDHAFGSIHEGKIHHSNLSRSRSVELIMTHREDSLQFLGPSELFPPHLPSKRVAGASLGCRSCSALWVISVMNALAEQTVAVGRLARRVAVLSRLWGCRLIRVMDDSETGS